MFAHTKEIVYDRVTGSIIAALERGVAPWVRPWTVFLPFNLVSRRPYRGINILSCLAHQLDHGHTSDAYLTYQQAKGLGGWIRQREHGVLLVLYREVPRAPQSDGEDDPARPLFLAKCFTVFNIEQAGGLEHIQAKLAAQREHLVAPLEECERVVVATGARIRENGTRASYCPSSDLITMPPRSAFSRSTDFYATLYHELTHWSGASHRLNRDLEGLHGGTRYAREELVAELGACFLAARTGIEHITDSASYIGNWLQALRDDKRFIFGAAKLATQAAGYIYPEGGAQSGDQLAS